jgi:hypothetical protein
VVGIYLAGHVLFRASVVMVEGGSMKPESMPGFENYFGAALFACGITWFWDYVASMYFPGQAALNLTLLSALVYMEAAFLGAFGLARRLLSKHMNVGLRVGFGAWMTNMVFRLIVFELAEALYGMVVYMVGFIVGGILGGLFARKFHGAGTCEKS